MTNIDWTSFLTASIAVALTPGPASLFVARTAIVSGRKAGYRAMLGIMAGDTCLITLSVLGVSALFRAYPSVFYFFKLAGAVYLFLLGVKLLLRKPQSEPNSHPPHGYSFVRAITITLLNPKAVFFFMAFFPLFLKSPEPGQFAPYAVMALVFQWVSATYLGTLIYASCRTASALRRSAAVRTVLEKLCGCAFIGFG